MIFPCSTELTQCIHSHLFTGEEDAPFAFEITTECTKLKVLVFSSDNLLPFDISDNCLQSFTKVLKKSTSLQTLSLGGVHLSDMVSPPCMRCNVSSPDCISLYYMYRIWRLLGISVELSSNSTTSQM